MSNDLPYLVNPRGKLVIVSGPSGAGKSSVCKAMLDAFPRLVWSVSATTRPKRPEEIDGRNYHFMAEEEFLRKLEAGEFIEHARVHGHYYGTLARPVDEAIEAGCSCLLDIDVQGAAKIKDQNKYDLVLIFIDPPNWETLRQRLMERGSDSTATIERRMQNAIRETEMAGFYHYRVVNEDLGKTIETVREILQAETGWASEIL